MITPQQVDEELTPVASQILNAQIEITIDGEIIPSIQEQEQKCKCLPCEFVGIIIISIIFLFVGVYVFFGRLFLL
jgi:hypothetical protein